MKLDYFEYTIGEHFMPAIINDDFTGLDDSEATTLKVWLENNDMRASHWVIEDNSENYCVCEISGLVNRCVVARLYFPERG
jgi:hypothetical protein